MAIWDTLPGLNTVAEITGKEIDRDLEWLLGSTTMRVCRVASDGTRFDAEPEKTLTVAEAFIATGLVESRAELRRLLQQGATLRVSGVKVQGGGQALGEFPSDKRRWVIQRGHAEARVVRVED